MTPGRTHRILRAGCALLVAAAAAVPLLAPASAAAADAAQCPAPTITLSGSGSVSLNAGDVAAVPSGQTFSGGLNQFPAGATVCVSSGATFAPQWMNNAAGDLVNLGTVTGTNSLTLSSGFVFDNQGTATLTGLNVNGTVQLNNAAGATLAIANSFSPSSGTVVSNDGTFTVSGTVNFNDGTKLLNTGTFTAGTLNVDNAVMRNNGTLKVASLQLNSSADASNACFLTTTGDVTNNSPSFANSGYLQIGGNLVNNSGALSQTSTAVTSGTNFTNNATVTGFGQYRFSGNTVTQGAFVGSSNSSPIIFQDLSPSGGQIFDTEQLTVVNVVAGTVVIPDNPLAFAGCTAATVPAADVSTSKTGPATVESGQQVSYTITVANHGPDAADGVVVRDALPPQLTDPQADHGGSVNGSTAEWNLGTVPSGQTLTLHLTGTAPPSGTLTDTVSSTATTSDPDPTNNDGSQPSAQVTTEVIAPLPPNHPPTVDDVTVQTSVGVPVASVVEPSDPDSGQTVTVTLHSPPAHGSVTVLPTGEFTYTPTGTFAGIDTFTIRACDNGEPVECADATVTVQVFPVARALAEKTHVDEPVDVDLSGAVFGNGTLSVETGPADGTLGEITDGVVTYTPDPGFVGTDSFTYQVCTETDPPLCSGAAVTIEVLANPNRPPVVEDAEKSTEVDLPVSGQVQASDPDEGQTVTLSQGSLPAHGTATVDTDGQFTYTPEPGFAGIDSFGVVGCDDGRARLCSAGTVTVSVFPVAEPDSATTTTGEPVTINVTANDRGTTGPPGIVDDPGHGTAVASGTDSFTYTPNAGFDGTDTFSYQICTATDPPLCSTTTVTVDVSAEPSPDNPPVVADQTLDTVTGQPVHAQVEASDPDGDPLTYTVASTPAHGTVSTIGADGSFTYTPAGNFAGIDSFTVQACDNGTPPLCATGTVTVRVFPVAGPAAAATTAFSEVSLRLPAHVRGTVGAPTISKPQHGTATLDSAGVVSYLPRGSFTGRDRFDYTVCASGAPSLCSTAEIVIDVSPVTVADLASTTVGRAVTVDIAANDLGDAGHATLLSKPAHGTLRVTGAGTLQFTPTGTWTGVESVSYQRCASGPVLLCDEASVTLTVFPLLRDDADTVRQGAQVQIDVYANDLGDGGRAEVISGPHAGTARVSADPGIVYRPDPDFTGVDTFDYQRCSTHAPQVCETALVVITVLPAAAHETGTQGQGTLAATGTDDSWLALLGLALVLVGAGAWALGRRRAS